MIRIKDYITNHQMIDRLFIIDAQCSNSKNKNRSISLFIKNRNRYRKIKFFLKLMLQIKIIKSYKSQWCNFIPAEPAVAYLFAVAGCFSENRCLSLLKMCPKYKWSSFFFFLVIFWSFCNWGSPKLDAGRPVVWHHW